MTVAPPRIDNAPGLIWRPLKHGWRASWQARSDLARRGFRPTVVPLWKGVELSETEAAYISDQCQRLQGEMLVWGRGGIPIVGTYAGTLSSLIACYKADNDSGYKKVRFRTREYYDRLTSRIERDHGDELLSDIRARDLLRWHEQWCGRGIAMAHGLMGMLRTLFGYGASLLEAVNGDPCPECQRLSGLMSKQKFKQAPARHERLTAEHAIAIRAEAHRRGRPSIALAQAFQFECMLRQKDVIGEWVPNDEPGVSDVLAGNSKWLRGLRWSEIDANLILRHVTSKRQKEIEVDLKRAPMVMEELGLYRQVPFAGDDIASDRAGLSGLAAGFGHAGTRAAGAGGSIPPQSTIPSSGPVIVHERTGRPYDGHQFGHDWRVIADAAGVPRTVWNMDTRAGAISEATDAGAPLENVRHAATHSDISMTQRYSRGSTDKIAAVQDSRIAHRNKNSRA